MGGGGGEKLLLDFCKGLLGVKKSTYNVMVYFEMEIYSSTSYDQLRDALWLEETDVAQSSCSQYHK